MAFLVTGCQPEQLGKDPLADDSPLRLLLVADPFAKTLRQMEPDLEAAYGREFDLVLLGYEETRMGILQNQKDRHSVYDLVSFDVAWLGELVEAGALLPVDGLYARLPEAGRADFLEVSIEVNRHGEALYGLPIQPHAELLLYRRDWFEAAGRIPPVTTEEVLEAARFFNRPEENRYGISWNAHRGHPLGQTMAHLYAAFGGSLIDSQGRPTLDTPAGLKAARFVLELLEVSPPDILFMAWDNRIEQFTSGRVAMTYGWGARHHLVEENPVSRVRGKTGYAAAPAAPGVRPRTVLGQWSLGIPANMKPDRQEEAKALLEWLTSRETVHWMAERGHVGFSRYSLAEDPELRQIHPTYPVMERLSREGRLDPDIRPRVPEWSGLSELMGTRFFEMLLGEIEPAECLRQLQAEAEALFTRS